MALSGRFGPAALPDPIPPAMFGPLSKAEEGKMQPLRAVVTAGAAGLGLAIATRLRHQGALVHVCDADPAAVTALRQGDTGIIPHLADIADAGQVDRFMAAAAAAMGGIDLLVNNAGIAGPRGPVEMLDLAEWTRCLTVNLTGMFLCLRAAVPVMKTQGAGCIVNISSASVGPGLPQRSAYIAAKAGVEGLTRTLARELGPSGIRVNAIRPGLLDNDRARGVLARIATEQGKTPDAVATEFLEFVSLRCWIDPSEVAGLVWFLAADSGRHVSGQIIGVCGNLEWEG